MAKRVAVRTPDRLSGARSRIMTGGGFAFPQCGMVRVDRFVRCSRVEARMDGEGDCHPWHRRIINTPEKRPVTDSEMIYTYETPTVPATEVTVTYTVETDGRIHVQAEYRGQQGLPELPVFGMRFLMPTAAERYTYEGLSGETYPDRMAGGIPGVYEVQGLPVTPYMVPQDCGMHMQTKWLEIVRKTSLDNTDRGGRSSRLKITAEEGKKTSHFLVCPIRRRNWKMPCIMKNSLLPAGRWYPSWEQ